MVEDFHPASRIGFIGTIPFVPASVFEVEWVSSLYDDDGLTSLLSVLKLKLTDIALLVQPATAESMCFARIGIQISDIIHCILVTEVFNQAYHIVQTKVSNLCWEYPSDKVPRRTFSLHFDPKSRGAQSYCF